MTRKFVKRSIFKKKKKISFPKIYISVEMHGWVGFPLGERQRPSAIPDNRQDDPRLRRREHRTS